MWLFLFRTLGICYLACNSRSFPEYISGCLFLIIASTYWYDLVFVGVLFGWAERQTAKHVNLPTMRAIRPLQTPEEWQKNIVRESIA